MLMKKILTLNLYILVEVLQHAVNDKEFKIVMNEIYNNFIKDNNVKEFTVECGRPDTIN